MELLYSPVAKADIDKTISTINCIIDTGTKSLKGTEWEQKLEKLKPHIDNIIKQIEKCEKLPTVLEWVFN